MDGDVSNLVQETAQALITHSIEFISSNRVKLLEFFLHIPFQKIERFMRLDPILCNFPLKDENNKLLELQNIGRLTKAAVMKSTFAKSLVRDAWVNLRLKCLVLFRIAEIHMRALRIEEYWKFITEIRKEITSRLNTYADEEAYVFAVLLAMEDMKEHLRRHDLDKFIEQYQISIKDALGHLKRSDFSQLLAYRVHAAIGYAGRLAQNDVVVEERLCRAIDIFEMKLKTQNTLKQQQQQLEWELEQMKEIERLHELQQRDKQKREEEQFFKDFIKQQEEMKQSEDLDYQLLFNLYYNFLQKQEAQRNISQLHNNNNPTNINNLLLSSASRTQSQHETQATKQKSMMMILSSPDIGVEQNLLQPQKPSFQAQIDEYKNKLLVQQSKCDEEGLNTKNWIISEADRFIFYFCQLQLLKVTIDGCSQIDENTYKSTADKAEGLIEELKKSRHKITGKNELIAQFTELIQSIKPENTSNSKKVKKTKNLQDNSLEKILSKITEKDYSDDEKNHGDGMKGSIEASSPSRTLSKYSADYQAPRNLQDYIESASNKRSLHLRSCSNSSYNTNASPKQHKVPYQKLFIRSSFHDHTNFVTGESSDHRQHSKSTKDNIELLENLGEEAGLNTSNIVRRKKNKHSQSETGLKGDIKGSARDSYGQEIERKLRDIKDNVVREKLLFEKDGSRNYISPFDIPPLSPNSSSVNEGFHLLIPSSPIQKQTQEQKGPLQLKPIQVHDSADPGIPNIVVTSAEMKNSKSLNENKKTTNIQNEQTLLEQEPSPRQRTKSSDLLKDYSIIIQAPQEKDGTTLESPHKNNLQKNLKQVEQQQQKTKSIQESPQNQTNQQQNVVNSSKKEFQKEKNSQKETFLGESLLLNDTQLSPANQTMMHERDSDLKQNKLLSKGNQGKPPVNSSQNENPEKIKQECVIVNAPTDLIGNFTEQTEKIIKVQETQQKQKQQQNQLSRKSLNQGLQRKEVSSDTQNSQITKVLVNTQQIPMNQLPNTSQPQKAQFSVVLSQNYLQSSSHLPMKTFSESISTSNQKQQKKSNILSRLLGDTQTINSLEEQLGLTKTTGMNSTLNKTKHETVLPKDQQAKAVAQGIEEKSKKHISEHRRWKTQTEEKDLFGIHDDIDESSVVSQQQQQFLSNKKINTEQDQHSYQTSKKEQNHLRTSEDETAYSNGRKGQHLRMSSDSFQKYSHLVNPNYKTQSTTNFSHFLDKNESTSKQQYKQQAYISQIQINNKSETHSSRSFQANTSSSISKIMHNNQGISANNQHRKSIVKKNTFKGNHSLQQYLGRMQSSASDSSLKIIDSDCAQQTTTPWSAVSPSTADERQKKKNAAKLVVHQPKILLNAFHDQSKSFNSDTEANQATQSNDIAEEMNLNQTNKKPFFYSTQRDSHVHDNFFTRLPSQNGTNSQSLKNLRLLFHTSRIIRNATKDQSKSKFLQTQTSLTSNGDYGRFERGDTLFTVDTQGGDTLENSRSGLILHENRFDHFFSQSRQERETNNNNKQDGNDGDLSLSFSCEETELDRRKRRVKEVTMKTVSSLPAQELIPSVYESELSKVSKSIAFAVQKASLARDFEEVLQKTNFRFSLLPSYSQPQQQPQLKTDREIVSSSSSSQSSISSTNQLSVQEKQDNSPVASIQEIAESIEDQEDKLKQVNLNKKVSNNPSPRELKPQILHIPLSQSSSLVNQVEKQPSQGRGSTTTSAISQIQAPNQGVRLSSRISTLNVNQAITPGTSIAMTPGTNMAMTPSMSLAFTPGTNFGLTPGMSIGLTPRISAGLTPRINIISDEKRGSNVKNQSSLLALPNGSFSQTSALLMNPLLSHFKGSRTATPSKVQPPTEPKKPPINVGTNLLQLIQDQQRFRRKSITKPIQPPPAEKDQGFQRDPSVESVKQIKNIVTELNQAKQDLLDSSRGIISKQNTLFDQNSPSNRTTPSAKNLLQSVVSKFKPTTASTFQKRSIVTKNSFDSDKSEDMKSSAQFEDEPKKLTKPLLRRLKVFSESQENSDEEEQPPAPAANIISQQMLPTGKAAVSSPITANNSSFSGFKSINSIAMMFLGKKHWYNVQNKDDITRSQIQRGDAISRKITELNLRFPVVSFCTHRIGRFQNWKIHFVEYYPSNKCFQINFLSIDNLFYKMFIPARDLKFFSSEQQDPFVTIWPVVLSYLLEYMTAKKIELCFEQEASQRKKISFVDTGIGSFFSHQMQESSIQILSKELLQYKQSVKEKQGNSPLKSSVRRGSELDDSVISNDKTSARISKTKFSFFLGLVRKESYFPTFRDALAAAKIKKIFEILLYRYMYDQLRPTGKKLILKKDASTQRYKTLSKKIQKLENDLERSQVKQQLKMKAGNSVDTILSQKFGTLQLRKLVQKDVMKIPDKSEYQIEQIWKLRHRDTPYQLCSFIQKTDQGTYYLVSFSLAFKKDYNALLTVFMKKHEDGKGLKGQFDKIIQIQQLKKPMHVLNEEELQQQKAQKEYRLLSLIDSQATNPLPRSSFKRNSVIKLPTSPMHSAPAAPGHLSTQKKPISQKIFQDEDFKEILTAFDLNQLIRSVVLTQKIPKNFKHLCIKNIKRRIVITGELLFLKLDKAEIIRRKQNQPPEILVETQIPGDADPRMQDFSKKASYFNSIFEKAYVKSEFEQEKPTGKHRGEQDNNEFSDSDDDSFNNFTFPSLKIKEVEEEFDRLEKVERIDNSLFHELTFRCSGCDKDVTKIHCAYKTNGVIFFMTAELHGEYNQGISMQDSSTSSAHSAHILVRIFSPENRFFQSFSTRKPKAFALFQAFKHPHFSNAFQPPIDVNTRSRSAGDFSAAILKLCHKLTIGEITKRVEVAVPNLASLPAHETLKLVLLKNNFFMETQRSFKRFFIIDEITSFGKVFLQLTIFYDNPEEMLFVIEFQDFASKSKFYRMALNSEDMAQLLGIKFFPDDRQDIFIRVMRRIVCHIRFDHETFYSMPYLQFGEVWYRPYLDVPLRNRVKDGGRREQGEGGLKFSNKIMKHTFEKENMNKTKFLMEGYRKSVRIIFHRTFIHKNEFYILTIQKNLLLPEFWMLFIYSLKTGRRLMGYVQSKDVEQIQFTDLPYYQTLYRLFDQGQPFQKYKSFLDAVETKSFESRHVLLGNEKSSFFVQSLKRLNDFEQPLIGKSEGEDSEKSPELQFQQQISKSQFQSEAQTPVSQRLDQPAASMSDSSQQQSLIQQQFQQQQPQPQSASIFQTDQKNSMHQYLQYSKHSVLPQLPIDQSFLLNFQQLTKQQTDMSVSVPKPILDLKQPGVQHFDSFNENEEPSTKLFLLEKFISLTNQLSRASKQFSAPSPRLTFLARFVEIKTWDDIADKMILNNKGTTHTMQFGNVAVPMQEYISSAQIKTDSGQEIIVEYFIGKQKDKKGGESLLTESFEEISYPATLGYYIYLRFYYFNQVGIVHKKINLRELLNLFIADGYYKYQTNYMHSKLQQQDLNQLCDFVSYKIRSGTFSSLLNSNQFQFRRTGLESYSRKTLQTLVKEQEQEEVENSIAEKFVFSQKPYRIVKVYIKLTKRIVEFLIYSPQNASTFKKKYQIQSLYQHIPFIGFYFQAGLYRQLAKNFLSLLDSDLKFHFKKFLKERIHAPL